MINYDENFGAYTENENEEEDNVECDECQDEGCGNRRANGYPYKNLFYEN